MADTYDSEREALADAYTRTQLQRQEFGASLLGRADASKLTRQHLGANELARLDREQLAREQMGLNTLLSAERLDLTRDIFNEDVAAKEQARTDEMWQRGTEILGNIGSEYLASRDRTKALEMTESHNQAIRELVEGLTPAEKPTESPAYWKAQAMVPGDFTYTPGASRNGTGTGFGQRGKSGGTFLPKGSSLDSAFGKKSVVNSRMGGNGMFSKGTNPGVSGAHQRRTP